MEVTVDKLGRIVVPKPLRDALGIEPGAKLDVGLYGRGLQVTPHGRTARLVRGDDGHVVAESATTFDDDTLFRLIDEGRR